MAVRNQIEGRGSTAKPSKPLTPQNSQLLKGVQQYNKQTGIQRMFGVPNKIVNSPTGPAPASTQRSSSGGGGGGGGSLPYVGGSIGTFSAPAVEPPVPSVEEYQATDSILTAALAALDRALKDYNTQYEADIQTYDRDYNQALGNLGWRDLDPGDAVNMGWDWNDILTSSGRAYQNQLNDFANRGMLQSQAYADALQTLNRSLNDQRTAMDTARSDFLADMNRKKTEFMNQDTLARQQARAESTNRRAAQYGII